MKAPWLNDDRPASARYPWSRSVYFGLIGLLLPFVWVVEVQECGEHTSTEITGAELVRRLEPGEPELWLVVLGALFTLAAPWIAAAVVRLGPRVVVHVLDVFATASTASVWFGILVFSIFSHRSLRAAGHVVVGMLALAIADAIARLVLGVIAFRRALPPSDRVARRE